MGKTIGDRYRERRKAFKFLERLRINPEKAEPSHKVCSIGKSAVDGKWYGWSHRAHHGFDTKEEAKRFAKSVS